ncbi:electron transport complex subunit RsxD [Reinekea marinisedimentorum]|uniref:Ion-translocating oxidoreductase complex subunit D n=1 Tax=Reinekea marinisedimentorum TaxID=230495 RepID=A0A4R3I754_9GAMM|nr:electron transport complex subunit RsxD [Reinekea marinisedimentorum]TCS41975.1 electron transport complex protein RnfD [Reinekea marinisedimentorum]
MLSKTSPHITGSNSVGKVMVTLLLTMIPGFACLVYFFSWGYLVNLILASATALAVEAAILKTRKRPVLFFLKDSSALVTAALLACALPPLAPWWLTVTGAAIAVIFGKQLFGGLGQNPFNPAMVAYALLLVSLPVFMTTRWANVDQPSSLLESLQIIFNLSASGIDGITGATPLDSYKQNIARLTSADLLVAPLFNGQWPIGWAQVNIAFLIGGLVMLWRRIITWHIPVSLLATLAVMALLFSHDADAKVPVLIHLLSGSTMLAAFFIATDPVSAATSNKGKLYYGAGIGLLIYLIRTWGNYPDATAFAVLLMNFAAPLIDHYTRPRVYGHTNAVKGYKSDD